MTDKIIVITGGGTGGHVFPAISLAEEFIRRGWSVQYVGSAKGFEARHVPSRKIPFFTIESGAVKNQGLVSLCKTSFKLVRGFFQSLFLLMRFRPQAVIGVGGYVSVPVCVASVILGVPLFIQEQNVSVGIANRFLGRFAKKIFLGFGQALENFPKGNCLVTGNPIRPEFLKVARPYDCSTMELLILGGSQGATAINNAVSELLSRILHRFDPIHIVHQTGERDLDSVKKKYDLLMKPHSFEVVPFINDIAPCFSRASLVIARSGALTVSEILQSKRPAIFIPYPRKGQNDQTANAYFLEELGVARTVEQGEQFVERFWTALIEVFQPENLRTMQSRFSQLPLSNALVTICDQIEAALV